MFRRELLRRAGLGGAGLLAAPALIGRAQAEVAANHRKFIFVVNYGGWDPTRVFADEFDNLNVDMERTAEPATAGGLNFVDHPDRPSVRDFFTRYHSTTSIWKGILVPSVAHENCLRLMLTGSTRQDGADWPAIAGGVVGATLALPHVVAAGPSFPGEFGAFVTRTGTSGQLPALLDGTILDWSDQPTAAPSRSASALVDSYAAGRARSFSAGARSTQERALGESLVGALDRSNVLKELRDVVNWSAGSSFGEQLRFATDLLKLNVSRCVTVSFANYSWDTHIDNDLYQSYNFQALFTGLLDLFDQLRTLPGTAGGALIDETVVVVLSEMGRTPQLNSGNGKDHWPYTSAMVVGPGLIGDRVYGGYDTLYYGRNVDPASGDVNDDGTSLSCDVFGSTLLRAAGVDSLDYLPGVAVVEGALSDGG